MIYHHLQKNGVSFTIASTREPQEEISYTKNLGYGLLKLWMLVENKWQVVYEAEETTQ
jgi:hypothetical protein